VFQVGAPSRALFIASRFAAQSCVMRASNVEMVPATTRSFPFVPKSSARLVAGDYWGVPLQDGRWACGRVLQLMPRGYAGGRVGFLGGLLDWSSSNVPTGNAIAGCPVLEQGVMHVMAIQTTGGKLLGNRPLEDDGLEPLLVCHDGMISKGFTPVRKWQVADGQTIAGLSWWGYDVIQIRANVLLGKQREGAGEPE